MYSLIFFLSVLLSGKLIIWVQIFVYADGDSTSTVSRISPCSIIFISISKYCGSYLQAVYNFDSFICALKKCSGIIYVLSQLDLTIRFWRVRIFYTLCVRPFIQIHNWITSAPTGVLCGVTGKLYSLMLKLASFPPPRLHPKKWNKINK